MVDRNAYLNAVDLEQDLYWFSEILRQRLLALEGSTREVVNIQRIKPPELPEGHSNYADLLHHYKLKFEERLLLVLALVPHVKPQLLDPFFRANPLTARGYTELGGIKGKQFSGFLPTGETALFIYAGNDMAKRFLFQELFAGDHIFARHNILKLEPAPDGEPALAGAITISSDILELITIGKTRKPDLSVKFPARLITTQLDWKDIVLEDKTLKQIEEIRTWLEHGKTLLFDWGMSKKLRAGYRALFYGPPGTGKTFTACLLGKYAGCDVYRIDLSLVVSKYIGETEKNLSKIFNQAEHKNWILFFDEADALFGKRTQVADAHDRYANQEVSYLLQRIEDHDGVVILASNLKENLDDSFTRRFESIIHFPRPKTEQRLKIWKQGFSKKSKLEKNIDLEKISAEYELSGGAIMNVIGYASLMALQRGSDTIKETELRQGIKKEFEKEGRTA